MQHFIWVFTVCQSKSRNFHEHFIFANSVKRHICHVEKLRLGHDISTSVNDSHFAISQVFHFHDTLHTQFHENKTLKNSEFTVSRVKRVKQISLTSSVNAGFMDCASFDKFLEYSTSET